MSYITYQDWEQPGYEVASHTGSSAVWWPWIDTVVIHYPGCENCVPAGSDLSANIRSVQNTQRYYVNSRGYSIGYNFLVTLGGDVIEGRGFDFMNAANYAVREDGANWNYRSLSIQIRVNGVGDGAPTANIPQITAVNNLIKDFERRAGRKLKVVGHMDTKPTSCPGGGIYRQIQAGIFKSSEKDNVVVNNLTFMDPPERVFDTRGGSVPSAGYVLSVDTGATGLAAKVNLTAVNPSGPGHLRVHPVDARSVETSALNYSSGTVANQIDVPIVNGRFTIFVSTPTHVLVDLVGVWS